MIVPGAADQDVAGQRSVGADAEPVGPGREWTVEIAVIVGVGRRVGLVDDDLAAHRDAARDARQRRPRAATLETLPIWIVPWLLSL